MTALPDEDYWESSQLQAFNFDENESHTQGSVRKKIDNYPLRKGSSVASETTQTQPEYLIPISVIITDRNLKKYLKDDEDSHKIFDGQEFKIEETIKSLVLDKICNLGIYRSLRSKIKLLDEAILSGDGNCIIMVTLHLVKSLKPSLVNDILKSRPVAFDHYVGYLMMRLDTNRLTELAKIIDQNSFISLKLYSILTKYYFNKETLDSLREKLQSLYSHWFEGSSSNDNDSIVIKHYLNLIDWQLQAKTNREMNSLIDNSINACLRVYCEKYWNVATDHPYSPHALANKQGVTKKQLEWIFLISKISSQSWDDISKQFIKSNWFGNKKVINSLINIENIVIHLGKNNAPQDLLQNILSMIDDRNKSLSLATKFKCHRHIINVYVQDKDREALQNYKKKINPQSEDYFYAENALRSTITKWKN